MPSGYPTPQTEQAWAGAFGNAYLARNRVDWQARLPFWQSAIDFMHPANVLEVGCNAGWNLLAIHECDRSVELLGIDVNASAVEEARQNGLEVQQLGANALIGCHDAGSIDLVFTAGMLIHVSPQDLPATMQAIVATSGRYVLAIEYEAAEEEQVKYRENVGLWKRPYGLLYQEMGLRLLSTGVAGGFDDCTYWLLEKVVE